MLTAAYAKTTSPSVRHGLFVVRCACAMGAKAYGFGPTVTHEGDLRKTMQTIRNAVRTTMAKFGVPWPAPVLLPKA